MTVVPSKSPFPTISGGTIRFLDNLSSTPANAMAPGGSYIVGVKIDNSGNSTEAVYVRFYDHAAPTPGTDLAEMVLKCLKSAAITYMFAGLDLTNIGPKFATSVSVLACKEAGADSASPTAPTTAPDVSFVYA